MKMSEKLLNANLARSLPKDELMPHGIEEQAILRLRTELFAAVEIKDFNEDGTSYIRFSLGEACESYGVPYQFAQEIIHNELPTKLPGVPPCIAGVINRRGSLIAVVDLKKFFHTQLSDYNEDSYIIVITANGMTMGILADTIEGNAFYEPEKLDPPLSLVDVINPELIIGLHQGRTAIINVEALMLAPELQVRK